MIRFRDRTHAGQLLATLLKKYAGQDNLIVFGLPRGGVPVAYEVAVALNVPLDVFLVRKLGVPFQEELAMGAISLNNVMILNEEIVKELNLSQAMIHSVFEKENQELQRRNHVYRDNRSFPDLKNKTIILVDDGIATGATMRAAISALKHLSYKHIIIAVPVASPSVIETLQKDVDEIFCLETPENLQAIGLWYEDFTQTTDSEVKNLLMHAAKLYAHQ